MLSFRSRPHCENAPILYKIAVFSQAFALRKFSYFPRNRGLFAFIYYYLRKLPYFARKCCLFAVIYTAKNDRFRLKSLFVRRYSHCENSRILLETDVFSRSFALRKFIYFDRNRCLFAVIRTVKIDLFCSKTLSFRCYSHCENSHILLEIDACSQSFAVAK